MEITTLIELASILLLAGTKFAVAVALLVSPATNYNYLETVFLLIIGGVIGVVFFYYATGWVNVLINKLLPKKKKKKVFTKGNRRFIVIKNKYGLIGISALTPILFSIPLGCFLASRFYPGKKTTLPIMLAGIVFWAFILPLVKLLF
ncbi:MAG: hypothetical protein ACPGSL_10555 [Vicingaceae bacterium]